MKPVEQLINEVRLLYQSLVQFGDAIHAGSNVSMGMRAVMEYLDRNGDATVPQVARARRVSRQRIQTLVNPLLERGLVESISNPASKRSPLITLTKTGAKTILENCVASMNPGGRVLVVDYVIPETNDAHIGKLVDIEMLIVPGGIERTRTQFEELFGQAGLKLSKIVPTATPLCIVEGVRA